MCIKKKQNIFQHEIIKSIIRLLIGISLGMEAKNDKLNDALFAKKKVQVVKILSKNRRHETTVKITFFFKIGRNNEQICKISRKRRQKDRKLTQKGTKNSRRTFDRIANQKMSDKKYLTNS